MNKSRNIMSGIIAGALFSTALMTLYASEQRGAPPVNESDTSLPEIYGCVIMTDSEDFSDWGVSRVPGADGGSFTLVAPGAEGFGRGSGVASPTEYTAVRYYTYYGMRYTQVYRYDIATWNQIGDMKSVPYTLMAYDLGYDPVTEQIYGCFYSDTSDTKGWFGTADYVNGTGSKIADVDKWNVLAFDPSGQAYAIDMNGDLLRVNKYTGETSPVGSTGIVPRYPSSGTIDQETGIMYWTVCPDDGHSYLYSVDLSTAEATLITRFAHDEQVMGLFIPFSEALDAAPAAVGDLSLSFPEGSMKGNISFTMPGQTFGGSPLSGQLQWRVTCEGLEDKTGTATPGEKVKVDYEIDTRGEYLFCVSSENSAGISPRTRKGMFIGDGIPAATTTTLSISDDEAVVSWQPVTEAADGGYFNPDEVTYRLRRLPDDVTIEESTKSTSVRVDLPDPEELTTYRFEVTPIRAGLEGEPALTQSVTLGMITPPYEQKFDSEDDFSTFMLIDGNGDGKTWEYADGTARLYYSSVKGDDWLITPAVGMEEGGKYHLSFDVRNSYGSIYPERIEVKCGNSPDAASMTTILLEPTEITSDRWKTYSIEYIPEHTGKIYIGFHGISDAGMFWLAIDNITLHSGVSLGAPSASDPFKVVADFNGGDSVEISLTTPTENVRGEKIETLSKLELYRDEETEPFKTYATVAPGDELTAKDSGLSEGKHTYTAIAYNNEGGGSPAVASAFVGINIPGDPVSVNLIEQGEGYAQLSWENSPTDCDGFPMNPAFVSYIVSDMDMNETEVEETSLSMQAVAKGEQEFVRYGIEAVSKAGKSNVVYSPMVAMGKPYITPYRDSFNDSFGGILGTSRIEGDPRWGIGYDDYFEGVKAQDGDDSYLMMAAASTGDVGAVYTGKISLANCTDPYVSLFVYQFVDGDLRDDDNTLAVECRKVGDEDYRELLTVVNNKLPHVGWNRLLVSLKEFEGETVQLRFVASAKTYAYYLMDNLNVGHIYKSNLSVEDIEVPEKVKPGEEFEVNVKIDNQSLEDARGFSLKLFCGDDEVETKQSLSLPQGEALNVGFVVTAPVSDESVLRYRAVIDWSKDEDERDNELISSEVRVILSKLPAPAGLQGAETPSGFRLEWSAPDMTAGSGEAVTDSFEDYEPFTLNPGGEWRFVDVDRASTAVPQGVEVDGLGEDGAYAFIVMNSEHPAFNDTFAAHSGYQYLMAAFATKKNDDWAISPRLSGETQTISFYAKNYYDAHGKESIEVRYSTTGSEPSDFSNTLLTKTLETSEWQQISVDVPEGAKYVAIHYVSDDQYMLFIDDFTYIPAPWSERAHLTGYNVYCDGRKLNSTPETLTTFTDTESPAGKHTYFVTAVYEEGESVPSAPFVAELSEVSEIGGGVRIFADQSGLHILGAAGSDVKVVSIAGTVVADIKNASDRIDLTLPSGIYVVKAGARMEKIIK